ncbi:sensor histidine kinase NtrY-like [Shimia ponticola]|uniref:sensor histidine kinase NtrY-like n=1 Tax=Shimia ponticola TaxID=2582893 RepID=UPI0011BDF666|nr:PAS domain-containing sensor histidine kinase [Shimia ponticola]
MWSTGVLVALGPILAVLTFAALGPLDPSSSASFLRVIILADLIYVLVIAALVMQRIAQMIAARRAKSAGSRLHLRLTGVFALLALIPTVIVAVFATVTLNMGLEGWFSERVRNVVGASLSAAEVYEADERRDMVNDTLLMARFLNSERGSGPFASDSMFDGDLRRVLAQVQPQIQRGIKEAFVLDSAGEIRARGASSYEFDYIRPSQLQFDAADDTDVLVIEDWDIDELRALARLSAFTDRYLYISREVDGDLLNLLDETQETAKLYAQLENERGRQLFEFGLLYLGFAVILILAATWAGLWFAERLSRPIGRLAGAAQRVGAGDLTVRVAVEKGDDEIAMLGRYFNQMTKQLGGQRERLLENTQQIERRRRLFDSVLSSVTSGVVGVDVDGNLTFINRSAERLLGIDADATGMPIRLAIPEFADLFDALLVSRQGVEQQEIKLSRSGAHKILFVRMAVRAGSEGIDEGYVVAFEDVTDLVSAQRMAAWGDVARRIAHEIKNPLTPIQLSAERIKRKFGPKLGEDSDNLDQMTDVIVRQTNDLRRIVDEFSKFARMPEPVRKAEDICTLLRGAILLQENANPHITYRATLPAAPIHADVDATMITQAFTNLLKNGAEAIETRTEKLGEFAAEIRVSLTMQDELCHLTIDDNGIGLPEDRMRLFEPYVTSRDKGTGLGLSIVLKIIEEHDGTLTLVDAPNFGDDDHTGARADIHLPLTQSASAIQPNNQQEAV